MSLTWRARRDYDWGSIGNGQRGENRYAGDKNCFQIHVFMYPTRGYLVKRTEPRYDSKEN